MDSPPLIWCAISGHGFGHAAQVVPVLNALGCVVPGTQAILRTTVPRGFFEGRLRIPWEWSPAEQDVGCVQHGPLAIDVPATWDAHLRFHATWPARVAAETEAIRERRPALVLSDVSYLAIEAGARAEVPAIALASLTWDAVLAGLGGRTGPEAETVLGTIRAAYARATLAIRPTPGLPLPANPTVADVGPIGETPAADRPRLRASLGAAPGERVVLVGFGGIPLAGLPLPRLAGLAGYRFVVDGPVGSPDGGRIHPVGAASLPFRALLASCDVVVTKPGYGIVVEAVAAATPVVYVRRGNFADEPELVAYAHRHGRAAELPAEDFHAGRWRAALEAASAAPPPRAAAPALTGAEEAARVIVRHLAGAAPGQAI